MWNIASAYTCVIRWVVIGPRDVDPTSSQSVVSDKHHLTLFVTWVAYIGPTGGWGGGGGGEELREGTTKLHFIVMKPKGVVSSKKNHE